MSLRTCRRCGESFQGRGNRSYCRRTWELICGACEQPFQATCGKRPVVGCSQRCSAVLRAAREASLRRCGDIYRGITSQRYCGRSQALLCAFCGVSFADTCGAAERKSEHCDSICRGLARGASPLWTPELVRTHKNVDVWARGFSERRGRKPSLSDLRAAFPVRNLPTFATRELFDLMERRESWLEQTVADHLASLGVPFQRHNRELRTPQGGVLELDFLLPEHALALEVQDIATHSRQETDNLSRYGEPMKGPAYHERKRRLARTQLGVHLVDLWEEDVHSGTFREILDTLLMNQD